jgi:hypothetical protein
MRLPLPVDFISRDGTVDQDAKLLNAYGGEDACKRPGSNDLGLIESHDAKLLTCYSGNTYSIMGETLSLINPSSTTDMVGLSLAFDGANDSTIFTDAKGHTFTAAGSAKISTAQYKFGGSSGLFARNAATWISTPANQADLAIGTQDFTIDAWVRINSFDATWWQAICGNFIATTNYSWALFVGNTGDTKFRFTVQGGTGVTGTSSAVVDTWYYVAVTRRSGLLRIFVNGAEEASATDASSLVNTLTLKIGGTNTTVATTKDTIAAYIDDFRMIVGRAVYTKSFTPPTIPNDPDVQLVGSTFVGDFAPKDSTLEYSSQGTGEAQSAEMLIKNSAQAWVYVP